MLTIILALLPFIIFSIMGIDFYITDEREKRHITKRKKDYIKF